MKSRSSWRSDAGPFDHLVAHGAVAEATSAAAWLQAQLDVEAAFAAAQAAAGVVPADAAAAIATVCRIDQLDLDALGEATERNGVPVIGIVEQLRAALADDDAQFVHHGSTSQDILDTAAMIVATRAGTLTADRLEEAGALVDALSAADGTAPMIGRTLGQFALPTTFANVTGRWRRGLVESTGVLRTVTAELPVQLGGPVGDGSSYGPHGAEIAAGVAERLGLAVADGPWSTVRTPIARLAGAWGVVGTVVGDIATQLVALMASDVGELAERADDAGGSSSMTHKHNPIAAISARAAALQVPGLVATLLHAAGGHDFERASGAWHAEWPALNALLRAGGSAADWLVTSLRRVEVDTDRMATTIVVAEQERTG